MRYAVISDVHGNIAALEAVVADAARSGASAFLFLGDYYGELPYPCEVADCVRSLGGVAILGNKEGYLQALSKQNPAKWADEQLAALYWSYRALRPDQLEYLKTLPPAIDHTIEGVRLRASHQSRQFFSGTTLMRLGSRAYSLRQREQPYTRRDYLNYLEKVTREDPAFSERLSALGGGIFAFGHSHIQWHLRAGDSLLVNPGSCGMPLDFDTRAPYTLLDLSNGKAEIEERRVAYPIGRVIDELRASELLTVAPLWSELTIRHLVDARERVSFFLEAVEDMAKKMNRPSRPYDNDVWRAAGGQWLAEND